MNSSDYVTLQNTRTGQSTVLICLSFLKYLYLQEYLLHKILFESSNKVQK